MNQAYRLTLWVGVKFVDHHFKLYQNTTQNLVLKNELKANISEQTVFFGYTRLSFNKLALFFENRFAFCMFKNSFFLTNMNMFLIFPQHTIMYYISLRVLNKSSLFYKNPLLLYGTVIPNLARFELRKFTDMRTFHWNLTNCHT